MKRVAAVFLMAAACRAGPAPLRLGTTYTVQQSGALAVLESLWTGPAPLTTVVAPSGQILRAAANGDLDVVITHAPALEQRLLVGPGHALLRCPLAASRFAIVGPAADPARVATAATAAEAFRRIAGAGGPFVSRGDSSGTHVKELALWRAAGVTPAPRWYLESGADQAATLHLADLGRAVCLARRLVWHTREGARAVAGRGSDAGAALVPGVGRRPGGDAPPRRSRAGRLSRAATRLAHT